MTQCNSICIQYRSDLGTNRYSTGQKWCSYCGRFLETDKFTCPCCSIRLRSNRRSKAK